MALPKSYQYDRKTILSLKLRSQMELRKITRAEMFTRLQVIRELEPIIFKAFRIVEEQRWENQLDDQPHGHPWHVSFHASQFPGDDPQACPRQALYRMMGFPSPKPFTRRQRSIMAVGKALEVELVRSFEEAGILLSASPDAEIQTGFELPDAWFTGSVDAIIQPFNWNKPVPVEIKSKDRETLEQMLYGAKGPDVAHVHQIKAQLGFVRLFQKELWPALDPVTHGFIYYMSRGDRKGDNDLITAEFRIDYDEKFFNMGVDQLRQWKRWFEEGILPELNPGKRDSKFGHPNGWRWSKLPCAWCDFKKTCQLDFQAAETDLTESVGVNRARIVDPKYDPDVARKRVFDRWEET